MSCLIKFLKGKCECTQVDGDLDEVINYIRQPVTGTKFFNPTTGL